MQPMNQQFSVLLYPNQQNGVAMFPMNENYGVLQPSVNGYLIGVNQPQL